MNQSRLMKEWTLLKSNWLRQIPRLNISKSYKTQKKIYMSIPCIHTTECHCKIQDRLDKNEMAVKILLSDRLGYTL